LAAQGRGRAQARARCGGKAMSQCPQARIIELEAEVERLKDRDAGKYALKVQELRYTNSAQSKLITRLTAIEKAARAVVDADPATYFQDRAIKTLDKALEAVK
jgi:hypothetical protein